MKPETSRQLDVRGGDGAQVLELYELLDAIHEVGHKIRDERHAGCTGYRCDANRWDCPRQA